MMAHPRVLQVASLLQICIDKKAYAHGKLIHAHVLRHGLFVDTFLANRLVEFYGRCRSSTHAERVFAAMHHRNVFSWNAIVSVSLNSGDLDTARHLFDRMPERNVVSWNMAIAGALRGGLHQEVLRLCSDMMRKEGFVPTRFTLGSVLSACGALVELDYGRWCHGVAVKVGVDVNSFVENALVGMYAKCGSMDEAAAMFELVSEPSEVTFTAMMGGLVQHGSVSEALRLFGKMRRAGIPSDSVVVSTVLGACARAVDGIQSSVSRQSYCCYFAESVHTLLIKCGFESDIHACNSLIDLYVKWGLMDRAELIFLALPEINVVSWNILIGGYVLRGEIEKAMDLFQQMEDVGLESNDVTHMVKVSMFARSGDMEAACRTLDKIVDPSLGVWNNLLSGYCQQEEYEEALQFFRKMQSSNMQPDQTTLAVILSCCAATGHLKFGKQIHAASTRLMLHVDMFVASSIVDMYSKCGCIEAARHVFDRMPDRDVVSWNSLISGFALHSLSKEAFTLFKEMRANDVHPTEYTYASLISSCAGLASLAQGKEIHAVAEKGGYTSNLFVGSSMINMYAKCGRIDEARCFFDGMPVKNIVSWNEMIHAYAQNGLGTIALELFGNMLKTDEKPDGVTFIAVLTACSHSGLVDEGLSIFNSIEKQHAITPCADHYTCIIDALGRAGRFEEVKILLDKMPYTNDPIIWEVLLSSCRVHANISLGKLAAEQLFHLDPQNSAPYLLLASIYGALGRWNDVNAVRRLMDDRGVAKNRGYSWIDHKDGLHVFMVDDMGGLGGR